MRVGELVLRNGLMLAPMAGVSDLPFRLLCREQGAELAVTEMVSAKALHYKNKATEELLRAVRPMRRSRCRFSALSRKSARRLRRHSRSAPNLP